MKRTLAALGMIGLMATSAAASNIIVRVQGPAGEAAVNVAPGGTVNYRIQAELSDNVNNVGIGLIGLSLDFTGGVIDQQAATPASAPMTNFVIPDGMTNPAGFGGTMIGGDLIQIGGAQNTINNTEDNALFPIGTVIQNVGAAGSPVILTTGSFTLPGTALAGQAYQLNAFDVFANVILPGTGDPFWATAAAGVGAGTNLTVNVGVGEASVVMWESVRPHEQGVGNVALEILNTDVFSEPRTGVTQLVVTFSGAINPATAAPGNVVICGNDINGSAINLGGIAVTTAATAGNTKMEINFNPKLPNVGRYKVAISGVLSAGGPPVVAGTGGLSRVITALQGDASGDRRVNATDVGGVRTLALAAQSDPIDPLLLTEVRSDANDDGRVNATDVGGVRSFALQGAPFDARNIAIPVCP